MKINTQMKRFSAMFAAVAVLAVVSVRLIPFAFDDAYIHFRIAENLAKYGVPYFNIQEPVMATSSPVWTCVLALLALTPIPLPLLVSLLNSILTVLGAFLWSLFLQKAIDRDIPQTSLWLFRLVYVGILLPSSAGLMETPLAMCLVGWACLLLTDSKPVAWAVIAISIFTRYELIVFAFFAAGFQPGTIRKHALQGALCFFIPVTIFLAFLLFFFPTVIPQTVTAKQIVYSLSRETVFSKVFFSLVPKFTYPILGIRSARWVQMIVASLVSRAWILAAIYVAWLTYSLRPLSRTFADRRLRWVVCVGGTGVLISSAYIMKHVFLHEWYAPLFCIPIVFFFFVSMHRSKLAFVVALGLAILPLSTLIEYPDAAMGQTQVLRTAKSGARVQRYIEVGRHLNKFFPDARLMTSEIGGLGISFRGMVLDGAGLITPSALKYHPIRGSEHGIGGIPAAFISEIKPELIVSYPVFLKDIEGTSVTDQYLCLDVPAFSDEYITRSGSEIWGCKTLRIYIRKDIADDNRVKTLTNELGAHNSCR